MTNTPLHFELPENLTAKKFLRKLSKKLEIQISSQQYTLQSFYDSFDWRLYTAGIICEFTHSQNDSHLSLIDRNNGAIIAIEEMLDVPRFSGQFTPGSLKSHLEPHLEMRALLPLCQLPLEVYRVNVLNKDQKTILRLQIDEYEFLNNRIRLIPLKGYDKAVRKVSDILQESLNLKAAHITVLNSALKQIGRKPNDYHSKVIIELKPEMRADKATKLIYRHLMQAMDAVEAGTIEDTDSEFLHDFRVAIRRTRAGLSQIKNTLPSSEVNRYTEFFAWLGKITSPTRDLDVYLLNYEQYKAAIPISLREDISPLYDFLKQKQVQAQKKLTDNLKSSKYKKQLADWEQYLKKPLPKQGSENHVDTTIKEVADQRIWKVYRRLLKEGNAIGDSSPAEALHDLRKTGKKLRYLMEFFQSLYPNQEIKTLIKVLKNFQTVLGDFQDYDIQETNIKLFSEEMMANNVLPKTLLAMGVLIQHLDARKCAARNDFAEQFAVFKHAKNQTAFKTLFSQNAKVSK